MSHPRQATGSVPALTTPQLVARARGLVISTDHHNVDTPPRTLLGITGPPGCGKSTFTAQLADELTRPAPGADPRAVAVVGMDGFHLAQAELDRLGRADRKGAPDTFDAAGFVALLNRLLVEPGVVYAPVFHREIEQPIAGEAAIAPSTLVLVEGNYLLLDGDWAPVRELCAQIWYLDVDRRERVSRLITRHQRFRRSPEQAREWVLRSDEANARLIEPGRDRADLVVKL
jgi:pantothenate kinase